MAGDSVPRFPCLHGLKDRQPLANCVWEGTSWYEAVRPVTSQITHLVAISVEPATASRGTALLVPEKTGKFSEERGEGRNRATIPTSDNILQRFSEETQAKLALTET